MRITDKQLKELDKLSMAIGGKPGTPEEYESFIKEGQLMLAYCEAGKVLRFLEKTFKDEKLPAKHMADLKGKYNRIKREMAEIKAEIKRVREE